jgi:hypothetical protein
MRLLALVIAWIVGHSVAHLIVRTEEPDPFVGLAQSRARVRIDTEGSDERLKLEQVARKLQAPLPVDTWAWSSPACGRTSVGGRASAAVGLSRCARTAWWPAALWQRSPRASP